MYAAYEREREDILKNMLAATTRIAELQAESAPKFERQGERLLPKEEREEDSICVDMDEEETESFLDEMEAIRLQEERHAAGLPFELTRKQREAVEEFGLRERSPFYSKRNSKVPSPRHLRKIA